MSARKKAGRPCAAQPSTAFTHRLLPTPFLFITPLPFPLLTLLFLLLTLFLLLPLLGRVSLVSLLSVRRSHRSQWVGHARVELVVLVHSLTSLRNH